MSELMLVLYGICIGLQIGLISERLSIKKERLRAILMLQEHNEFAINAVKRIIGKYATARDQDGTEETT